MEKYIVEFYEDQKGHSEVKEYMNTLNKASLRKMIFAIERLSQEGPRLGKPHVRWLIRRDTKIWELKVGRERFPFFLHGNSIIIISDFTKQDKKTPSTEIRKAEKLQNSWNKRNR